MGKEISAVKTPSESSVFLVEINHVFLSFMHQLTSDCNFFFCTVYPLLGRGFSLHVFFCFLSPTYTFALVFLLSQLVLALLLFRTSFLLGFYCSSYCLKLLLSSWSPSLCPD